MKISANFARHEFGCRCGCGFDAVDIELLSLLEKLRYRFGCPVIINGGNRCFNHNENVGGAPNSFHTKGMAADFYVSTVPIADVWAYMNATWSDRYGMGLYDSWIHLDVRREKARWQD